VISWSHHHTSVTSDDMVISHEITEKDMEDSGRMIYVQHMLTLRQTHGGLG